MTSVDMLVVNIRALDTLRCSLVLIACYLVMFVIIL